MNWLKKIWKAFSEPLPPYTSPTDAVSIVKKVKPFDPAPADEISSNFTPRAQQVLALARKEADRFKHNFVGTEHLLLGLIKLGQGVAVNVLQKLGLDLETLRTEVERQVGTGPDQELISHIPYTPRVKKVLAFAAKEAKALNHTYVGTEHILLGNVYCSERHQAIVVYRNALFKGLRRLFREDRDSLADFFELEQADGQQVFVAKYSVIKFCEPGVTPNAEIVPGKQP